MKLLGEKHRDIAAQEHEIQDFDTGDHVHVVIESQGNVADGFGLFGGVHVHVSGDIDRYGVYEVEVGEIEPYYLLANAIEKVDERLSDKELQKLKKPEKDDDVIGSKNDELRGIR